jgi:hypothetical protein
MPVGGNLWATGQIATNVTDILAQRAITRSSNRQWLYERTPVENRSERTIKAIL